MTLIVAYQLFRSQRKAFARHRQSGGAVSASWPLLFTGVVGALLMWGLAFGVQRVRMDRDYGEFERALALMAQGAAKSRQAELLLQNFQRNYPEEPMTYWNLAVIHAQTGKVERAKAELQALLNLEPDNKEARDFLRELESIE